MNIEVGIDKIPPIGTKVELTLEDIFGVKYSMIGKIAKEPYQHGYICKSGAWSLYSRGDEHPCYKIEFIPKGKRISRFLQINSIVKIKVLEETNK